MDKKNSCFLREIGFELIEVVTKKEDKLSWFVSWQSSFVQPKKEIESLLDRENENYKLMREQHKKNAGDFREKLINYSKKLIKI